MIKKLNLILFITLILLICISAALRANLASLIKPPASERIAERQAVKELCENAARIFAGFFSESHRVKFYSDIDTFAKSQSLHITSVTHRIAPADSSYSLLNINKTLFTINLNGRYTDIKNFLFILDSQPYINSFESLKLSPAAAPGRAALEVQYALYSLASLKPFKPGDRSLITKFTPLHTTARIDSIDKSLAVDLFDNRAPRAASSNDIAAAAPDKAVDKAADKPGAKTSEVDIAANLFLNQAVKKASGSKPDAGNKTSLNTGRLVYNGYYFDSKKGIKAFIDFDGRVEIISAASTVGGSYTVTALSESKVILSNTEEPYDTMEAALNTAGQ
jgi:hypothetical protein